VEARYRSPFLVIKRERGRVDSSHAAEARCDRAHVTFRSAYCAWLMSMIQGKFFFFFFLSFFFFFFFFGAGDQTQGLALARQALYQSSELNPQPLVIFLINSFELF